MCEFDLMRIAKLALDGLELDEVERVVDYFNTYFEQRLAGESETVSVEFLDRS